MSVQQLRGRDSGGKLELTWILLCEEKMVAVQVAKDSEFTDTVRMFIAPRTTSCTIDIGFGTWFFRVGVWNGSNCSDKFGTVNWSGIYGAVPIMSLTRTPALPKSPLKIVNTQSIEEGLRLYTGYVNPCYAIMEYSKDPNFPASKTKVIYGYDFGKGYFDCVGLDPVYTYSIRITIIQGLLTQYSMLGTWATIHQKKAKAETNPHDLRDAAIRASDKVLLREAKEKPNLRFTSQSDYAMYLAAKARNQDTLN